MEKSVDVLPKRLERSNGSSERPSVEGIDLTQLWEDVSSAFWRERWFVAAGTLATAALFFAGSVIMPKTYEATAYNVIVRSRPRVELVEQVSMADGSNTPGEARDTLLALTRGSDLVVEVIQQLRADARFKDAADLNPDNLLEAMQTKMSGDLMAIRVTWKDPVEASVIANTWARVFIQRTNEVYGIEYSDDIKSGVTREYDRALASFRDTSQKWANFIGGEGMADIQRQIREKEDLRNTLQDLWQTRVGERAKNAKESLSQAYDEKLRLSQAQDEARSLAEQIKSENSSSSGSKLALILLKSKIYGHSANEDGRIMLNVAPQEAPSSKDIQADLLEAEKLAQIIDQRLEAVNKKISELEASMQKGLGLLDMAQSQEELASIKKLDRDIQRLRGTLVRQEALQTELDGHRVAATRTYRDMAEKLQQFSTASSFAANQVRLASLAHPAAKPVSPRPVRNAATGAGIGLIVFSLAALARAARRHMKPLLNV